MKPHRVFYVNIFGRPEFARALAERTDIELVGFRDEAPDAETDPIVRDALVYHVSSGVNDMSRRWWVEAELLERAPRLLLASAIGSGYDTIDVDACTRAGVLVVNQAGAGNAEAVAEHMFAVMIALSKRIVEADRRMRRAPGVIRGDYVGRNVRGKTAGIVGFGHVGKRLTELCRLAFGMRVLVHDQRKREATIRGAGAEQVALDTLLTQSDFVLVCCAYNEDTQGMFGAAQFALMPRHACFITAARGGIHDEEALAQALGERRIAGAGLDVWAVEPPDPAHPLLAFDQVIATPHTAGATEESRIDAALGAARQIIDVIEGRPPAQLINPQAWPRFADRYKAEFGRAPSDPG